jgi:hypothetical protein
LQQQPKSAWLYLLVVLLCSLAGGSAVAMERTKSDVVTLQNGDRLTGRILYVQYGALQLSSAHSGSVSIEWPSISSITSQYAFRVERIGGEYLAGVISTSADGKNLIVGTGPSAVSIPMLEVSRIVPYESDFWQRIYGSVSLGYNYTRATQVSQASAAFDARYSGVSVDAALDARTIVNRDPTAGTSDQDQIISTTYFLRPGRNFWGLLGEVERNQDLGIDARVLAGALLGRRLYQAVDAEVTGIVGVVYNQEWATGAGGSRGSVEGVAGGQWRVYRFTYPKANLDVSLLAFPSITDAPRFRASLNVTLTFKLTDRFALNLTEYGNYDSRPPDETAQTLDYGVTIGLSYNFGAVVP